MTGEQMRNERLNRGFALRELAREIDVPEQSLRRIEKDLGITPQYAKRIADFYGIQVTDMVPFRPEIAA